MEPEVSIVFTSYNHKEYLRQALESLLAQTYQNFELIIVDDCSTDGSQEILKEYKNKKNVRLFLREKNSGSYVKASNYGAQKAKGKYLLFAQCDDYAAPKQIERLMKIFEMDEKIGVVYSRSNLIDENGNYITDDFQGREKRFKDKHAKDSRISGVEMRDYLSFSCVIPNLSAAIIKKDLYNEAGGLPEKFLLAADWALWLELSERTDFYYLTESLNNFRQHPTTIRSKTKIRVQINEIYSVFYNHIKTYKLNGSETIKMKIGAGAIWFAYFIVNPRFWVKDFRGMLKDQWKHDKLSLMFLGLGGLKHVKHFLVK